MLDCWPKNGEDAVAKLKKLTKIGIHDEDGTSIAFAPLPAIFQSRLGVSRLSSRHIASPVLPDSVVPVVLVY